MSGRGGSSLGWAVGLWAVLVMGIAVAWSPRYWPVSVAITSLSMLIVCWTVASGIRQVRQGLRQSLSAQMALVALIGAWGFGQLAFHTTLLPQLTLESSLIWSLGAGAFVLGSQVLRDRDARRLFLELLLWSSTMLAFIAMLQFYSTPVRVFGIFPAVNTVVGTFLSSNQFAAFMELAAPIALWYMLERNPMAGGLCYAMILAAAITAGSRAGVILVGLELLVFLALVLIARRREARLIVSIFGGLALLVTVASVIAGTDQIRARFQDKNPYAVRRELFDSTLKLIGERPGIGYGMGTWRAVYPRVATFDMALLANQAHNDWAEWTAEGGIPFLLLMAALVIWIAKPAAQSIWGLGVLSVMLHSYVDYPTREPALLFLWFALAGAVSQWGRKTVEAESYEKAQL